MQPRPLVIAQHLLQNIIDQCWDERPFEACGILTGIDGRVLHAYATANDAKPRRGFYEINPEQQAWVMEEMEAQGEELVAIYHSHPNTAPNPSASDIRLAVHFSDAVRLILSLAGGRTEPRAWLIRDSQVFNVPLQVLQEMKGEWQDLRDRPEQP